MLVVPATCCATKFVVDPEVNFKKSVETSKDKPTEPVCNLNEPVPLNEPVNEPDVTEDEILIFVNPEPSPINEPVNEPVNLLPVTDPEFIMFPPNVT